MKCIFLVFLCGSAFSLSAQTNYDDLENWYYHPEKTFNFIANYDLDIAVINEDLGIDSTITFANKSETNTGVDVFWVHPTQLIEPPFEPTVVPLDEQPFALISSTILAQGGLLAKYGRFYAPRYQQATPAAFLDPTYPSFERAEALMSAYQDVKAAFENYLENHNNGNQIIIAAHSQGSFLSAMLLRDLFDNDPALREQLLCAVLPGMPYIFGSNGTYVGGQWENIPLCTSSNECGCIHAWRSFKETQDIPGLAFTLPVFIPELVDSGLMFRNVDLNEDWFVQDEMYYGEESTPLRFYIAPDAAYDLGGGANFIAFDQYFSARMKRTSDTKVVLAIDYPEDENDLRPNDLLSQENGDGYIGLSFAGSGFHNKDYHIYLWALMAQIDAKLSTCAPNNISNTPVLPKSELQLIPGEERGVFQVKILGPISPEDELLITDLQGKVIQRIPAKSSHRIQLNQSGCYLIRFRNSCLKMPVH